MKKRLSLLLITAAAATFLTACARGAQTQDTGTGSSSEGSSSRGSRRSSSKGFRTGQGTEGRGKCRTGSEVR